MKFYTINNYILTYKQTYELQKTNRNGLAVPLRAIKALKVAVPYKGDNGLELSVGDEILVPDEILRHSQNVVKIVLDGQEHDFVMVKLSDVVGIRKYDKEQGQ